MTQQTENGIVTAGKITDKCNSFGIPINETEHTYRQEKFILLSEHNRQIEELKQEMQRDYIKRSGERMKTKNLNFTQEELEELLWIVPQFKDTHEEHYIGGEREKVESIISKLKKATDWERD